MSPEDLKRERISGWALALVLFLHMVVLREAPGVQLMTFLVLLAGAVMRLWGIYAPEWLGRLVLVAGVVVAVVAQDSFYRMGWVGQVAGVAGAMMLLRPVTPSRGLKILFCILVIILTIALLPYASVDGTFVIVDVVVLMILAEQIHRPPEAALGIWASLLRSLRVVIPVSIVVMGIFWLFPNFALPSTQILSGFSGNSMNPGMIADIAESNRVAMVARFPEGRKMPRPLEIYWRAQVLEKNEELLWTRDPGHGDPKRLAEVPSEGVAWNYRAEITSNLGGVLPVLDRAVTIEARRSGVEVVVQELGGSVFSTVGAGALSLEVGAAADRASDAPVPEIGRGNLAVPKKLTEEPTVKEIAGQVIIPGRSTAENLEALGSYFRESGFSYSMRPGRVPTLKYFLVSWRKGFCEHYAAASANLLRLGGVPARVVTGYRGGRWNPFSRTITVRDLDAHAWVEAWDAPSQRWIRFDPTDYVAPDFTARIERNLDSEHWPWYRLAFSFLSAGLAAANNWVGEFFARLEDSGFWDYVQPVLFGGYALFATVWLARRWWRQRVKDPADLAARLLADLERQSARRGRRRHPGETPLAWLARMARGATSAETRPLRDFARSYEAAVYKPDGTNPELFASLRRSARRLRDVWRVTATPPPESSPSGPGHAHPA